MKAIFGKLAVVRADGVADDEATGIILTGIATSDLPTSLTVSVRVITDSIIVMYTLLRTCRLDLYH